MAIKIPKLNLDEDQKKQLFQTATQLAGNIANRPRKPLTDIQQQCGKRPLIRGTKLNQYNACVAKANAPILQNKNAQNNGVGNMSKATKNGLIIGGSILGIIIIFVVVKKLNNKSKNK